jgi:hypothetical protein
VEREYERDSIDELLNHWRQRLPRSSRPITSDQITEKKNNIGKTRDEKKRVENDERYYDSDLTRQEERLGTIRND